MKQATQKKQTKRPRGQQKKTEFQFSEAVNKRLWEAALILGLGLSLFLLLSLVTYHRVDPSWSHASDTDVVKNAAGTAGAWFADVLLYFLGYSAYLFPILIAANVIRGFMQHDEDSPPTDYRWVALKVAGFVMAVAAASGLLSLQLPHLHAELPYTAGGVVGNVVGPGLIGTFNFWGTNLILLAAFLCGITLFTGLSWLKLMDLLGYAVITAVAYLKEQTQAWYEDWQDQRAAAREAKAAAAEREIEIALDDEPIAKPKKRKRKEPKLETVDAVNTAPVIKQPKPVAPSAIKFQGKVGDLPTLELLDEPEKRRNKAISQTYLEGMAEEVEKRLSDFGVEASVVAVHPGPVVTRYELQLAPGVKVSKISGLAKDLARSLSVISVRIVDVIPGKTVVGLELPNEKREAVRLREVLMTDKYQHAQSPLSMALGKDIAGHPVVVDLSKMPHLLVAGTTGSGKSVGLNAMLLSILYKSTPKDVRLIMIDPKMLELSVYEGIPHLLTPVVIDMKEAANALRWCVGEMERRYRLMAAMGVRNLAGFNHKVQTAIDKGKPLQDPLTQVPDGEEKPTLEPLPLIVVVIDELADMMMIVGKKVEQLIARIAQKARAAGVHMILATQRPSVDVITGLIKANIPTRIAFQVSSKVDSRTILDQMGAEQLLGYGDMLYQPAGTSVPIRVHGAFVDDHEVHQVVAYLRESGAPVYLTGVTEDEDEQMSLIPGVDEEVDGERDALYDEAVAIVLKTRRASISSVQRRLKIGYNRAARILEAMEAAGVVSPMESNGQREILVPEREQ